MDLRQARQPPKRLRHELDAQEVEKREVAIALENVAKQIKREQKEARQEEQKEEQVFCEDDSGDACGKLLSQKEIRDQEAWDYPQSCDWGMHCTKCLRRHVSNVQGFRNDDYDYAEADVYWCRLDVWLDYLDGSPIVPSEQAFQDRRRVNARAHGYFNDLFPNETE
jgi:hypothetical protein